MNWAEICQDKLLATLPYRIESDCDLNGEMSFFDAGSGLPQSKLCPDFPKSIVLG
jgi:hypothetical protein